MQPWALSTAQVSQLMEQLQENLEEYDKLQKLASESQQGKGLTSFCVGRNNTRFCLPSTLNLLTCSSLSLSIATALLELHDS